MWHAKQEVYPHAMHKREVWPWCLCGRLENYINQGRFWPQEIKRRLAEEILDVYATLGVGLTPDCAGLRGREKPELYKTSKSREVSRNQDDLVSWYGPVK